MNNPVNKGVFVVLNNCLPSELFYSPSSVLSSPDCYCQVLRIDIGLFNKTNHEIDTFYISCTGFIAVFPFCFKR